MSRGLSYLASTDTALNDTANLLGDIRGSALGVAGTTSSDVERQAVVAEVDRALEQLLHTGNATFRGRYLFAGSQTNVKPYELEGDYVVYRGNDKAILAFSDIDVLYASNEAGQDVFGGISGEKLGGAALEPHLGVDTLLSDLRGGRGISPNGAISIADGNNASVVDLSTAVTLGDVARLIEAHPPQGRQLSVSVTGNGLVIDMDDSGGGNLTVTEVGSGRSAAELGIYEPTGVLTAPLVGEPLDPALSLTTRLGDLLGSKARGKLASTGGNNDLWIEATNNGAAANGTSVQFVDDELLLAAGGVGAGSEFAEFDPAARAASASLRFTGGGNDLRVIATTPGTAFNDVNILVAGATGLGNAATASYDSINKRLVVTVDDAGATTVQEVINAIDATGAFTAVHDDSVEPALIPTSTISAADISNAGGNTGNSGGAAGTLYVHIAAGATTANQAIAAINAEGTFRATLDASDNPVPAQAGEGLVSLTATASLDGGSGLTFDKSSGIKVNNVGQTFDIDFSTAETVEDLLNILNGSDAALFAEINEDLTGINIRSRASGADLQIAENGGLTATQLGVRTFTAETKLDDLNHGIGVLSDDVAEF
ncbi:MAG: hypothetical protein KDA61_13130, partial [Planctomycetales bacterium]|nr:hypothetical protein [Planctomycetales bacterium]